tara:strand:+ start:164 stop:484 length:321 start_codon:yes stop_codon:yes gene_type:complete
VETSSGISCWKAERWLFDALVSEVSKAGVVAWLTDWDQKRILADDSGFRLSAEGIVVRVGRRGVVGVNSESRFGYRCPDVEMAMDRRRSRGLLYGWIDALVCHAGV